MGKLENFASCQLRVELHYELHWVLRLDQWQQVDAVAFQRGANVM